MILSDKDPMPFGKYKGSEMANVPAGYLLWLADQEWLEDSWPALYQYIEDNYDVLIKEKKEGPLR